MRATAEANPSSRRSYAFLVRRLLPLQSLTPERRASLEAALHGSDRGRLRGEVLATLQELETTGDLEEMPTFRPATRVYRSLRTGTWIHIETPDGSLQSSRPKPDDATLAEPSQGLQARPGKSEDEPRVANAAAGRPPGATSDEPGAPPRGAAARVEKAQPPPPAMAARLEPGPSSGTALPDLAAWEGLTPFLELASIELHLEPFGDRLRRIVTQVETSLTGAHANLVRIDGDEAEALADGPVQVIDRKSAEALPHYREALRLRETQFATSAPVGADPGSGRIAAAVPLYLADAPWGILQVTWPGGSVQSLPALAQLLAPVAKLVAVAIQNQSTLEKLVFVDPLTGVYNRAFYERQVSLEIERANRTNQKFALLVLDIDDFKSINDRFGHRAGDAVLSQLAREVESRMRKIDLLFRYGGEEFVALLPGADLEEARRTAERLRLIVAEQRFLPEGVSAPLKVTVSIGGAVYPDQSRTKTGVFSAADTALYRAKDSGKNCVAF